MSLLFSCQRLQVLVLLLYSDHSCKWSYFMTKTFFKILEEGWVPSNLKKLGSDFLLFFFFKISQIKHKVMFILKLCFIYMGFCCYWYNIMSYAEGAKELLWLVCFVWFKILHENSSGGSISGFNKTPKDSLLKCHSCIHTVFQSSAARCSGYCMPLCR